MRFRSASSADLPVVEKLLVESGLPVDGVAEHVEDFIVAVRENGIAGVVGLERYGDAALLRSAAVSRDARGAGLGRELVTRALERATAAGVRDVYLLTTTAEKYFPRFGFTSSSRAEAPHSLRASREFQGACPDSAVLMKRALRSDP